MARSRRRFLGLLLPGLLRGLGARLGGPLMVGSAGVGLAGCGGGGDLLAGVGSGGTGNASDESLSIGVIRGLGSVLVNGVLYDDSAAMITNDEGGRLLANALRLSMVVEVRGRVDAGGVLGSASSIRVVSELRGPVQRVSAAAGSFVALGVTVKVTAATVFEGASSLAALRVGDGVEVWGFYDRSSALLAASRVEVRDSALSMPKARGLITAVDARQQRLQLGAQIIDYAGAALVGLGAGPAPGQEVRLAAGTPLRGEGLWKVDRIEAVAAPSLVGANDLRLEGRVSDFSSTTAFRLAGLTVDASSAQILGGTLSGLGNGAVVVVEGRLEAGVLKLKKLSFDRSEQEAPEFEIKSTIEQVTGGARFVIRGTPVDASGARLDGGTLADLRAGRQVEVQGVMVDGVLRANRLKLGG